MEREKPTTWAPPGRLLPMPRLCLMPGRDELDRGFVETACAGCVPGGCALAIGWEPGRGAEGRRS